MLKFNKKSPNGFTLIELLMVVAIIGLLASIIITSLNGAREKGRIAAGQKFDSHTLQVIGASAAGVYDFNEGTGTTTSGSLNNSNMITLNSSSLWSTGYNGKGYALTFNGSSNLGTTPLIKMNGTNETVSVWVKTTGTSMIVGQGYSRRLFPNNWLFNDSSGSYNRIYFPAINDGKWHNVAYTLNGTKIKVYVDGKFITDQVRIGSSSTFSPNINAPMNPYNSAWQLGGNLCSGSCNVFFNGSIDNLRIYNESI